MASHLKPCPRASLPGVALRERAKTRLKVTIYLDQPAIYLCYCFPQHDQISLTVQLFYQNRERVAFCINAVQLCCMTLQKSPTETKVQSSSITLRTHAHLENVNQGLIGGGSCLICCTGCGDYKAWSSAAFVVCSGSANTKLATVEMELAPMEIVQEGGDPRVGGAGRAREAQQAPKKAAKPRSSIDDSAQSRRSSQPREPTSRPKRLPLAFLDEIRSKRSGKN